MLQDSSELDNDDMQSIVENPSQAVIKKAPQAVTKEASQASKEVSTPPASTAPAQLETPFKRLKRARAPTLNYQTIITSNFSQAERDAEVKKGKFGKY